MKTGKLILLALFVAPVAMAATFTVTTLSDTGDGVCTAASTGDGCRLREAIFAANMQAGFDEIQFAPNVTGTIQLIQPLNQISEDLRIDGPGARKLTIRRNTGGDYRIFTVSNGTTTGPQFQMIGLTLSNGKGIGSGAAGGAILNDHGTVALIDCVISGNTAGNGAGISNDGSVSGGATLDLINCTLSGNVASQFGGAIFTSGANGGSAFVSLLNCTIADNSASRGAAIHQTGASGSAEVLFNHCTVSNNSASLGGIFNTTGGSGSSQVRVHSSLFRTGATGPNFANSGGTMISDGFNLSNDGALDDPGTPANETFFTNSGDGINADPKLDPGGLKNNGGSSDTIALLSNSPAINGGDPANTPSFDQRGAPRLGFSDIGSFEFGAAPLGTTILANISTRLRVETGDNVLIGGFIITGTQNKKVILRAIGPSLPLPGKLDNPTLELRDSSAALLESNDDWVSSPNKQAIIDSGLAPGNDLESAILRSLPANAAYTAIVRGANNGTGIGIVEAFDLDAAVDSKLANISTRGFVQTGDNILIAGTIILGNAAQKVIVRAIGPSLSLPGKLANPTMELRDQNGALVDSNDDWINSPNKQAIIDTGLAPANDLESTILQTLPANGASFTAIVRGVNNTTGIAVVEMFEVQ